MKIQPITNKPQPTFGILKGYKKTPYGEYFWGHFKNHKIEVYNAMRDNQKLIYVSDIYKNWVKSKLTYFQDGIKKIMRSERHAGSD